ncbi:MAG TPA: acyl carrier protein [Euzebya sp.]|nr:acyl carrier protein [Euzebya sp.]
MTVYDKVVAMLDDKFGISADEITPESSFEELDLDSLDLVEFSMAAEDDLGVKISDDEAAELKTVGDAVRLLEAKGASV